MCRNINHGGRRCPKEPAKHRAENRAAYGAQTAAVLSAQVLERPVETVSRSVPIFDPADPGEDYQWGYVTVPDDSDELLALAQEELDIVEGRRAPVSRYDEMVKTIEEVRELLKQPDPVFIEGYVSKHGWRVENEVRRLGHLIGIEVEVERQRLEALFAAEHDKQMATTKEEQQAHLAVLQAEEDEYLTQLEDHDKKYDREEYIYEWQDKECEPGTPEEARKNELARFLEEENELARLMQEAHHKFYTYKTKYEKYWESVSRLRSRAATNVLRKIRNTGGTINVVQEYSSSWSIESLDEISHMYPTDWIAAHNSSDRPLMLSESTTEGGRAAYMHDIKEATWTAEDGTVAPLSELVGEKTTAILSGSHLFSAPSVFLHEFAHRVEHVYQPEGVAIVDLEEIFLQKRTTDGDGNRDKLIPYTPLNGEYAGEKVRPDHFVTSYIGKAYDIHEERTEEGKKFREVLSVGMESIFGGTHGYLVGDNYTELLYSGKPYGKDLGHRAFILGLLAAR